MGTIAIQTQCCHLTKVDDDDDAEKKKKRKARLCSWLLLCLGTSAAALLVGLIVRIIRICRSVSARPRPSSSPRSSRVARDSFHLRVRLSQKVLGS